MIRAPTFNSISAPVKMRRGLSTGAALTTQLQMAALPCRRRQNEAALLDSCSQTCSGSSGSNSKLSAAVAKQADQALLIWLVCASDPFKTISNAFRYVQPLS